VMSLHGCATARYPAPPGKTNFLIILADDVGSGDVGYACITNSSVCPHTPDLDAMALSEHSVVFRRFYAGAGVSPAMCTLPFLRCVPIIASLQARNQCVISCRLDCSTLTSQDILLSRLYAPQNPPIHASPRSVHRHVLRC